MRSAARLSLVLLVTVSIGLVAACGRKVGPDELPTIFIDTFTGTIVPGGIDAHLFNVRYAVTFTDAEVVVTSLTSVATGAVVPVSFRLGFGASSGDTCTLAPSYSSTRTINQVLSTIDSPFIANPYCVMIFDDPESPTIPEPLNYTMVVSHY